jgi:hypothetical protein
MERGPNRFVQNDLNGPLSSTTAADSHYQIDPQSRPTATQPDRTGDFTDRRSVAGQAWRLLLADRVNSDGLAVSYVRSPPNRLIVICPCQDCGSSVRSPPDRLIVICRRPWEVPDGGCQDCGSIARRDPGRGQGVSARRPARRTMSSFGGPRVYARGCVFADERTRDFSRASRLRAPAEKSA